MTENDLQNLESNIQDLINLSRRLQESNKYLWLKEDLAVILSSYADPVIPFSESKQIYISKKHERVFLDRFNETVDEISKKEKINPTLLFSKKSQKDFLVLILNKLAMLN